MTIRAEVNTTFEGYINVCLIGAGVEKLSEDDISKAVGAAVGAEKTSMQTNVAGERAAISSLRKAVERFTDFELELVAALAGSRLQPTIRNALAKGQEALRSTEVAE